MLTSSGGNDAADDVNLVIVVNAVIVSAIVIIIVIVKVDSFDYRVTVIQVGGDGGWGVGGVAVAVTAMGGC